MYFERPQQSGSSRNPGEVAPARGMENVKNNVIEVLSFRSYFAGYNVNYKATAFNIIRRSLF